MNRFRISTPEGTRDLLFSSCRALRQTENAVRDALEERGVKATFFVVGNWADQYPEQAKAIVDSGCELMNHSNAHDHYNSLTAEQKCSGCQDEGLLRTGN